MPFRFVHTADIHLDSPLRSLALRNTELAGVIGDATRQAFERTIDLCLDEQVDALMIAGDLYDGEQTSMKTALFLAGQLQRLNEAGIRTFIVRGNHDAESRITRELTLPDSVTVFGGRADVVAPERRAGAIPVAVHGISFRQRSAPESLVPRFKAPVAGAFNIGLLHTSLGGSPHHNDYAPCSIVELTETGFDYWCLGHIHKRAVHSETPHIVMPGIPQGRHINEDGVKSVTLVHVGDDGAVSCRARPTGIAQFERLAVDLAGVDDWHAAIGLIGRRLERARKAVDAEHLVVRLELHCSPELAWRLRRDLDLAKEDAQHRADTAGNVWIEKVEAAAAAATARAVGPVGDLASIMRDAIAASPGFRQEAADLLAELGQALPPEARDSLGPNEEDRARILDALIAEGCDTVLAHLHENAGLAETDS